MGSVIFSLFIVFCIFWVALRTGKRRTRYAMRNLAQKVGGVYSHGGFLSRSYVTISRGATRIQIEVQPMSRLGGRVKASLFAPWINRPDIQLVSPQTYIKDIDHSQVGMIPKDLKNVALRMDTLPAEQSWMVTTRGNYELCSLLATDAPHTIILWYEIASKYYELLLAETEPGVNFEASPGIPNLNGATCQVCGTQPSPHDTVTCDRCGAPHHAECWEYNGGCAIFGCKHVPRR